MELPEDCIADILCRTTPVDAARVSVVSKNFCSAADSDTVWDRFLPSDHQSIISQFPSLADAPSKKALYLALSDHPILIDHGKKSFQLDKKSGKKCYMLGSRALSIAGSGNEIKWFWLTRPESRFPEVAKRSWLWLIQIRGVINTLSLSPNTQYGAFLVYKINNAIAGYDCPVELSVSIAGGHSISRKVCLVPDRVVGLRPSVRSDGWMEIEMGEFFISGLEDEQVQMSVMEIPENFRVGSFILEGIEVRPKEDN